MDLGGYDLLVVDAMHKANFASRLCHSCTPNCATKVTAVEGKYMIGVYAIEDIREGEELTFNYHSVTEVSLESESVLVGSLHLRVPPLGAGKARAAIWTWPEAAEVNRMGDKKESFQYVFCTIFLSGAVNQVPTKTSFRLYFDAARRFETYQALCAGSLGHQSHGRS
jgi:hypothetical protein